MGRERVVDAISGRSGGGKRDRAGSRVERVRLARALDMCGMADVPRFMCVPLMMETVPRTFWPRTLAPIVVSRREAHATGSRHPPLR